MGLPASWTLLSLIHYAVCLCIDRKHNFRIKGDDLIAIWSRDQIDDYCRLLESVGLTLNSKKSACSRRYGTFCEGMYEYKKDALVRLPTFSLRSFSEGSIFDSSQLAVLLERGVPASRIVRAQHVSLWARYKPAAKRSKISMLTPKELGGLGFLPGNPKRVMNLSGCIAFTALHNGQMQLPELSSERSNRIDQLLESVSRCVRWTYVPEGPRREQNLEYKSKLGSLMSLARILDLCDNIIPHSTIARPVRDAIRRAKRVKYPPGRPSHESYARAYALSAELAPTAASLKDLPGADAYFYSFEELKFSRVAGH